MFALVHFSRVFPFIHPYLFPIESGNSDAERVASPASLPTLSPAAVGTGSPDPQRQGQARHLKRLYRRHQLNQRSPLTYSGAARAAW